MPGVVIQAETESIYDTCKDVRASYENQVTVFQPERSMHAMHVKHRKEVETALLNGTELASGTDDKPGECV